MDAHAIDQALCRNCGLCLRVCSARIIEQRDEKAAFVEAQTWRCMNCGQCVAVCPSGAVAVPGITARADAPGAAPATGEQLLELMYQRRSMRSYRDEPVSRELLDRLVEAATTAPMSFPPTSVEVTVLSTREQVAALSPPGNKQVLQLYQMMQKAPGRLAFRLLAGRAVFNVAKRYLIPIIEPYVEQLQDPSFDFVAWGAPAMLVFHSQRGNGVGSDDAMIACTHSMLMAEALGLGSVMLGFATMVIERDKNLKARFGIPPGNQVNLCLAVGWPGTKFAHQLKREMKSATVV